MVNFLNDRYNSLSTFKRRAVWVILGAVILVVALFVFGWLRNKVESAIYRSELNQAKKAAAEAEARAVQWETIAKQALNEKTQALKEAEEAHEDVLEAVAILNDATKTTAQKRQAYEAIRNRPAPVVVTGSESTDALCERARQYGIHCDR